MLRHVLQRFMLSENIKGAYLTIPVKVAGNMKPVLSAVTLALVDKLSHTCSAEPLKAVKRISNEQQ